jgi:LuxR family transcriptional regulator, maltose regulon positive regulatory protein
MRRQPVVWVSGPAGCGKTTLVSSYLEACVIPCLWYQIDESDSDPATFFYYLGQVAQKASPRKRKPLPLLTPEYLQGVPTFTRSFFENLYGRLKTPSVLVFDNYQEVPAESPFHEVILNGLSQIPEGVSVILICRSDPPPAFIRLRANELMRVLGWNELRLTPEESRAIVQLRAQQKLSQETIRRLTSTADGWAAGLVLMLESLKRGIEPQIGKLTPEEIFEYFGNELFDKTDEEIQEFFLKTAFLPKMTVTMAEELTGLPSANRILSTLSRDNYFTEKRFHGEPIYQYHPLFRGFLLSRAKSTFSKEGLFVLCSRASTLLEEAGQAESSAALLRDMDDWDGLVRLITKQAPLMVAQGRFCPLEDWLDSLPMEIMASNPWLLYWRGACQLPFAPSQSQVYFEKAFELFKNREDVTGIFLAWSGVVDSILSGFEDFKPLDRWISALDTLRPDFKSFPSEKIKAAVASSMFSALVRRQPHHPKIDNWAQQILASAESHENGSVKIQTLMPLAMYCMYIGDTEKTLRTIHQIRSLSQSADVSPLALLAARFAEAMFYSLSEGRPEKCLQAVSDALELAQTTGIHRLDHMLLGQGVVSALNAGDTKTVAEWLDKMAVSLGSFKPWESCFYHLLKTRAGLLTEDPRKASIHAELALKYSLDAGSPISSVRCHLAKAHAMHELGRHKEAVEHLAHTFSISRQINAKNSEFWALLAEALFALDQGKETSALNSLRKALGIGKEEGYFSTFIDRPLAMARLCVAALEAGIEVEYVQELIRKRNLIPPKIGLHLETWPWPLRVLTLGRFIILKDGKPVQFSRKVQQKPLAVLKAMIAFGGKRVNEEEIMDGLWPEADGDMAQQSFATALHRLRQLLGNEKAIQRQEGQLTLDDRFCWVDVWAFEAILEEAEAQWKKGGVEKAINLVEKATAIYRGPFLAKEIEQPWTISLRERLRSKFLRQVEKMGSYWQQGSHWENAVECYLKGLEVDDLAEEFYQGLMTCYHKLGRKTDVLGVYQRYRKTLSSVAELEPSPKIEAICKNLTANNRV